MCFPLFNNILFARTFCILHRTQSPSPSFAPMYKPFLSSLPLDLYVHALSLIYLGMYACALRVYLPDLYLRFT